MIYRYLIFVVLFILLLETKLLSDEKFEGLIVSVDSEAITTYDLSERINNDSTALSASRLMNSRDKQMLWVTGVGLAIIGLLYML